MPATSRPESYRGSSRVLSGGLVRADGIELREGEFERRLVSKDAGAAAELPGSSGIVVLDTTVTPELEAEGLARDLVRVVQQAAQGQAQRPPTETK